ncbi:MAG: 2-amino-4-hydroxy-6-hydroxymethyldihydropteridine diphosphokinase [Saprospiraceae bacterium]
MNQLHNVYLHLGSNIGDREAMLAEAERQIEERIGSVLKKSAYYETAAWGKTDQPDFINYALLVETKLSALETLEAIHQIEASCGRERLEKWTARVLDIDIIFYDDEIIENTKLTVPHPHMQERNFVLIPMMDIAADVVHPILGLSVEELYDRSEDGLEVIRLDVSGTKNNPMTKAEQLLQELRLEATVTRKFLAVVPFDQKDFKPAEKSEALGRLAIHVAEILSWWTACIEADKLDFFGFEPKDIKTTEELLNYYDELLASAKKSLASAPDEIMTDDWSMTYGEEVLFTLPKEQVLRIFCMNHLVHHRAQLGVYLRILGVPIPATYGPSADDEEVILVNPYS